MKITTENIVKVFNKNPKRIFMDEDLQNVDWIYISAHERLSSKFIEKFSDHVDWRLISKNQNLSPKFIENFVDKIDWEYISIYQKLSLKFIEKHHNKINWYWISRYQKLSPKFIDKFEDKVYWFLISRYQKLSPKFIEKFDDRVCWFWISRYQKLPKRFRKKYADQLDLPDPQTNTLYWTESQLLDLVKQSPYEVKNGYIYAWKAVRKDRYSLYNFQYRYEKGETYRAHCDCNLLNDISFGLAAWTKEHAEEYGKNENQPYKLIRVKIAVKDIGVILKDHNWKIRCRKFTVIS